MDVFGNNTMYLLFGCLTDVSFALWGTVNVYHWHGGSVACTACTAASQQEGHGFDSRMGRCWLWGAGPPQSAQWWAISRAFLCGVCMFSLCSQGGSSTKNPNRKTCRRTEHSPVCESGCVWWCVGVCVCWCL